MTGSFAFRALFPIAALSVATSLAAGQMPAESRTIIAGDYHVGRTTSGLRTTTEIDQRAEGREWVKLASVKDGDWLQLHLPGLRPGRYAVAVRFIDHASAPACDVAFGEADGSELISIGTLPAGSKVEHAHWTTYGFRQVDVGEVTFPLPGFKTIRFTAHAVDGAAGQIGIDSIILTEIIDPALNAPADLQINAQGPVNFNVSWKAEKHGETGFFIERRGRPFSEWTLCGYVPGGTDRFVATGMCPNTPYEIRIRGWSARGLGPVSAMIESRTLPVGTVWQGKLIQSGDANTRGRAGEGSVVKLRDGCLLMYYNEQARVDDFAPFAIFRTESSDDGETWSKGEPLLTDATGRTGYMMPSLLRLRDGRLGFTYARRENDTLAAHRVFRISTDEGKTWSEETVITADLPLTRFGYTFTGATGPHDRLIQAANGDLFVPFHLTTGHGTHDVDPFNDRSGDLLICATVVYRSSDLGRTWQRVFGPEILKGTLQTAPYAYYWTDQLLAEPSLVETQPGHLLLHMRNPSGFFYQARSSDHGTTWTPVHQSPVNASLSPAKLLNVAPGVIAMAFDPWVEPHEGNLGRRFALGTMVSRDEGRTWENFKLLELSDPTVRPGNFCYPYFFDDGSHLHAFYFGGRGLDMTYRRLPSGWFLTP